MGRRKEAKFLLYAITNGASTVIHLALEDFILVFFKRSIRKLNTNWQAFNIMKELSSRCTLRLGIWRTATINCAIYLKYFPLPLLNEIKICNVAQLFILIGSVPSILVVNRMISFYRKSNCMSGTCMVIVWNRQPPTAPPPKPHNISDDRQGPTAS